MASVDSSRELVCANNAVDNPECTRVGKFSCTYCLLVLYCGPACQKSHWKRHRAECRDNPLLKANWRPQWEAQKDYVPRFIGGEHVQPFNHRMKFLWGNMPAFDLLKLASNEGVEYNKKLDLLFAASGDIRNVALSVVSIPDSFKSPVHICMNDRDMDVVGRNVIMLLLALTEDDAAVAADNILHLWYSSFITQPLHDTLRGKILPLVQAVCAKINNRDSEAPLGKTWTFGRLSLRLVLLKKSWFELRASLEVPAGLTLEGAQKIRQSVTIAPERVDYRERVYFGLSPGHRSGAQKFRESGVLLSFGAPRDLYTIPNPTIFRDTTIWPMKDDADPISGWDIAEVMKVRYGPATNDIYGKICSFIRDVLLRFHQRLKNLDLSFELFNVDARDLSNYTGSRLFDRIEVSNISDKGYLGTAQTLYYIGRLLKHPSENPHATLVTLFLNAVDEIFDDDEKRKVLVSEMREVCKYITPSTPRAKYDANLILCDFALPQIRDVDKYFDRYMKTSNFDSICQLSGMSFKKKHTIIDPWPLRLKKKHYQKGAKEDFFNLLASTHSGCERYMEWTFNV
ncbi:hypothetical protein GGS23DRAFT_299667 [Durotheca rogersii]|uniref:uncharacterized protein n=1 Tax=Durotheca rogersii TaxID=419775 RepID=UPI0022201F96|nr:uncharacterized protein GGS23DRAFT_299667 [Durotheca rogersii]KAI5866987.1 hypothetical protein GGS23DRAFT_299667 [Durotheca rogersii]